MNSLCSYLYDKINSIAGEFEGNYLEIGAFNGAGAASIARNFPNKTIYIIDPFIEDGNTQLYSNTLPYEKMESIKRNFINNTKELDNIKHFENTTEEVVKSLSIDEIHNMNVSMVLIDGDHHTEFVVIDYDFAMDLIGDKSGFIVFDDMHITDVIVAYERFIDKYKNRIKKIDKFCISGTCVEITEIK